MTMTIGNDILFIINSHYLIQPKKKTLIIWVYIFEAAPNLRKQIMCWNWYQGKLIAQATSSSNL